jgi:WD40 repeat protein
MNLAKNLIFPARWLLLFPGLILSTLLAAEPGEIEDPKKSTSAAVRLGDIRFLTFPRHFAWSKDSRKIYAFSDRGAASRWNIKTGKQEKLPAPDGGELPEVYARFSSADAPSSTLVTISYGDKMQIIDLEKTKLLKEIKIPEDPTALIVLPGGKKIVTGHKTGDIIFWDAAKGKKLFGVEAPDAIKHLSTSGDGSLLVVGWTRDRSSGILIYDTKTYARRARLGYKGRKISGLAISPNGTRIAVCGRKRDTIDFWNTLTGQIASNTSYTGSYGSASQISFSPDGRFMAATTGSQATTIWNLAGGKPVTARLYHGKFSPDSKYLLGTSMSGISVWNLANSELFEVNRHAGAIGALALTPKNKTVITAGNDGTLRHWDPSSGKLLSTKNLGTSWGRSRETCFMLTPDARHLAIIQDQNTYALLNGTSGRVSSIFSGKKTRQYLGRLINLTADGRSIFFRNRELIIQRATVGGAVQREFTPGKELHRLAAIAPDGSILAYRLRENDKNPDGTGLKLYDMPTKKALITIAPDARITYGSVIISPDNKTLICMNSAKGLCFYDIKSGKRTVAHKVIRERFYCSAFSSDSSLVALYFSFRAEIALLDGSKGKILGYLPAKGSPSTMLFSPDKKLLITGGRTGIAFVRKISNLVPASEEPVRVPVTKPDPGPDQPSPDDF